MATTSEQNGNRVSREIEGLDSNSNELIEIKESDLFLLDQHAENQTKQNLRGRNLWMIFSSVSGALFLVILIKTIK